MPVAKKMVIKNKNVNKNNIKITINSKKGKKSKKTQPKKNSASVPNIINIGVPQLHPQFNSPYNNIYPIPDKQPVKVEVEKSFSDANKLNQVGKLIKQPVGNIPVHSETQTDPPVKVIIRRSQRVKDQEIKMTRKKNPSILKSDNQDLGAFFNKKDDKDDDAGFFSGYASAA